MGSRPVLNDSRPRGLMVGQVVMHALGPRARGSSQFGEAWGLQSSDRPRWPGLVWLTARFCVLTAPAFVCGRSFSDPSTVRGRSVSCAARIGHGCPLGDAARPTQGAHSSRRSIRTPQGVDRGAAWATLRCLAAHQRRRLPRPPPWLHIFLGGATTAQVRLPHDSAVKLPPRMLLSAGRHNTAFSGRRIAKESPDNTASIERSTP